jgi:hypothetical protein
MTTRLLVALAVLLVAVPVRAEKATTFAGSVQLDYLAVFGDAPARDRAFDGSTVELSLKLAIDVTKHATANIKVCVACHGPEVGMAYFDVRLRNDLSLRVGRFTPAFGRFPTRHDPANHRTSDKPLPYDMGRMVRFRDWNEGILPTPWVDNGAELAGTHDFGRHRLAYAVYAVGGPKGTAAASDFDYTLSRSGERYYVDNNSQPAGGARIDATFAVGDQGTLELGASTMLGHYDEHARLGFLVGGVDLGLQYGRWTLRAEYLARWMELDAADAAARFKYATPADRRLSSVTLRDGFYVESEVPLATSLTAILRWDGLRQFGNVLATSRLRARSVVLRYTAGVAVEVGRGMRVKASVEGYDFSDFEDELATHLALTGAF